MYFQQTGQLESHRSHVSPAEYQSMTPVGEHFLAASVVTALNPLVKAESMEISNDPRFFTPNVLDKRFAAFSALSICSTLFTGTALTQCFSMKKDWDVSTVSGVMQLIGFLLTNVVLFSNVFAAFTSVAQTYLTYRLMTAGPTGFEIASSFYLNPNIAFWRHMAVKQMLASLPLFVLASAFRLFTSIEKGTSLPTTPAPAAGHAEAHILSGRVYGVSILAVVTFAGWASMSCLLFHVRRRHLAIFKERYSIAKDMELPLMSQVRMLSERGVRPDI